MKFKQKESNTEIACIYVHSQWCSSVGMLKENTTVLSTQGYVCSPSKSYFTLHGSDGMIWSLETLYYTSKNTARADSTSLNVYVLYVY